MEESLYHELTPKEDVDDKVYFEALDFALQNPTVHNIAITGPYGSGKSSVIHSYLNSRKHKKDFWVAGNEQIKDITISLVNFTKKSQRGSKHSENESKKDDIDPNLVEYAILEQLFFHEKGENLPDSRFSRIKKLSKWDLGVYVLYLVCCVFCVIAWVFQDKLGVRIPAPVALLLLFVLPSYAIYKILPILRGLSIKKISLATASIEVGDGKAQSVLNLHIDEILYFFQETGTNLLIFEDLDRFNNPDIFTKLKEINYLINNSDAVEQHVTFIYALRDDMFMDKYQRTKFFDFIVPIIPFVDGNNAVDKLYVELSDKEIATDLCVTLSYYIGDMRLVYNIVNEYHIYSKIKQEFADFDKNRMLAMVAYKNCYPQDFALLIQHKGVLHNILSRKSELIEKDKSLIHEKIIELKHRIEDVQLMQNISVYALRLLYIQALFNKTSDGKVILGIHGKQMNIDELTKDEYFEDIKNSIDIDYFYHKNSNPTIQHGVIQYKFEDLEKVVNLDLGYDDAEYAIKERPELENLKNGLRDLENKYSNLENETFQSLLLDGKTLDILVNSDSEQDVNLLQNKEQVSLIEDLLSMGYINENYDVYLSMFHEGMLKACDHRFWIDVLRQKKELEEVKLENAEELVRRINNKEFLRCSSVWNYDLVDALMVAEASPDKCDNLMANLSETDGHIGFIDRYVRKGKNIGTFLERLCKTYTNIWADLHSTSDIGILDEDMWLHLLLKHAPMTSIDRIFQKNESGLANMEDFFLKDDIKDDRLLDIATVLDIKFKHLSKETPSNVLKYLYDHNLYAINKEMIELVMPSSAYNEVEFMQRNFTMLHKAGLEVMLKYVRENLHEYLENIWIKLPIVKEGENEMFEILSTPNLNSPTCREIIAHDNFVVQRFDNIPNKEGFVSLLFEMHAIAPTWENLRSAFLQSEEELTDDMIVYLNNPMICSAMKGQAAASYFNKKNDSVDSKLARALFYCESLTNDAWLTILDHGIKFRSWHWETLNEKRVKLLISNHLIDCSLQMYQFLREHYFGLHILWMKNNFASVVKLFDSSISFSSDEIDLLTSVNLYSNQYIKLLPFIKAGDVVKATKFPFLVCLLEKDNPAINEDLAKAIMTNSHVDVARRLPLIINHLTYFDIYKIEPLMQSLGYPYLMLKNGKHPLLPKTDIVKKLLDALINIGYVASYKKENNEYYRAFVRP